MRWRAADWMVVVGRGRILAVVEMGAPGVAVGVRAGCRGLIMSRVEVAWRIKGR
ncbi:MAG: hypothetical protein G8D79_01475 [gamma proteobacterium symbiont of Ctena orbiculata]